MTLAFWCVLIAGLMPFALAGIAKAGDRSFDNRQPRAWYERVGGYRQRAWWAQQNSFEALPLFAAAVIIAHVAGAAPGTINTLAMVFIAARIAFAAFYLADWSTSRSIAWLVGLGACIGLFIAAA
ncbi:MAG: MAPEG family protein [Wenzhouxiangella sp.]